MSGQISIDDQELFDELRPFQHWLKGRILNAGCGKRNIEFNTNAVRLDINPSFASNLDLTADAHFLPFRDNSFDSILSVAVLEHTKYAWDVVREFNRVLRPGGYALIAIPFFQPQHGAPQDFVRFTQHGIRALMEWGKFKVIDVQGVHSFGYTAEWIAREFLITYPGWRHIFWPIRQFVFPFMRQGKLLSKPVENMRSGYYAVGEKV